MPSMDQAENLMRAGAFDKAKDLLVEIIAENPDNLRAICNIGITYTETGENTKAIKALEYYIKNDEHNPYAWEALGCAQFRTRDLSSARESLEKAIELLPDNASALRNLGILHGVEGHHSEELELLQRSMRLCSTDYRTLYALNFAFKDTGKSEERTKILNRLMEMDLPEIMQKEVALTRLRMTLKWE